MPVDTSTGRGLTIPREFGDGRIEKFDQELQSLLESGASVIHLSCAELDHFSSVHVGVLWAAIRTCQERGCLLRLCDVSAGLQRVLDTLDLADMFNAHQHLPGPGGTVTREPREAHGTDNFRLTFTRSEFPAALVQYRQHLDAWGMSPRLIFELHSIFYEVVQNILLHAGLSDSGQVGVQCQFVCGLLTMTIVDGGVAFDPTAAKVEPDLRVAARQRRTRGLGIFMMRKLTDHIEYKRVGNQNVLTIEKRVR
ncbi:MAG: ATP-binding protein [Candidatus Zixiibacteriota bacterium]